MENLYNVGTLTIWKYMVLIWEISHIKYMGYFWHFDATPIVNHTIYYKEESGELLSNPSYGMSCEFGYLWLIHVTSWFQFAFITFFSKFVHIDFTFQNHVYEFVLVPSWSSHALCLLCQSLGEHLAFTFHCNAKVWINRFFTNWHT